jgi:hypothetical protein
MKYLTSEGDINNIHVSEEMADGSFQFNQGVDNISATLNLVVRGATNPAMANIATLNYLRQNYWHPEAGIAYQGIPLNNISITSTGSCFAYKASCTFDFGSRQWSQADRNRTGTTPENPIINDVTFEMPEVEPRDCTFTSAGGSARITRANKQTYYATSEDIVGGHGLNIGFNGEGYDGTEIIEPAISYSITISAPQAFFSFAYRNTIVSATGCVNSTAWDGFAAGEVLFKGATVHPIILNFNDPDGNPMKDWYWRITYEFEARKKRDISFKYKCKLVEDPEDPDQNPTVWATDRTAFVKNGFQYVWYLYVDKIDETTQIPKKVPVQAVVSDVYDSFEFKDLLIPGLTHIPDPPEENP